MHKVLFIAYYFPPITGSGVFRSAKFAKYLPQSGWQPYIISTTEAIDIGRFDETLLGDIPPGTQVWRLRTPEPRPFSALARAIRRHDQVPTQSQGALSDSSAPSSFGKAFMPGLKSIRRTVTGPLRVVENPPIDPQLYWSLRLIPLALRIIRRHKIDLIYTSSAPWSVLLTGLVLKRLSNKPWVVDMRDPWISNEYVYRGRGMRHKLDVAIEKAALSRAEQVVISSIGFMDELQSLCGSNINAKTTVITNGFDAEDYFPSRSTKPGPSEQRSITHSGTVIPDRFAPLLRALVTLREEPETLRNLSFMFHGWHDPRIEASVSVSGVGSCLSFGPMIGHSQAITNMLSTDVLLLLLGEQAHWGRFYPGKLFEYLRAGKPILGIGPLGVASALIDRCGVGCFVSAEDTPRLVAVLRQIANDYSAFKSQYYDPRPDLIAQFDRRVLTERLANVFDSAVVTAR